MLKIGTDPIFLPSFASLRKMGSVPIFLLAYLATMAAPIGLADLSAFAPRQALARAERGFPAPSDPAWARGRELLVKALALDPKNPNYAEQLAQWHERAANRFASGSPAAAAHLKQSLENFRRAAVARPGSPYTWSSIALIKVRLREIDNELAQAVTKAARFGPWEPEVQMAIADVFFTMGEGLPPEAQRAGRLMLINAVRTQDEKLMRRAEVAGRLALLCSLPNAATSKFAMRCI